MCNVCQGEYGTAALNSDAVQGYRVLVGENVKLVQFIGPRITSCDVVVKMLSFPVSAINDDKSKYCRGDHGTGHAKYDVHDIKVRSRPKVQ